MKVNPKNFANRKLSPPSLWILMRLRDESKGSHDDSQWADNQLFTIGLHRAQGQPRSTEADYDRKKNRAACCTHNSWHKSDSEAMGVDAQGDTSATERSLYL